jgi:hypothetical protein
MRRVVFTNTPITPSTDPVRTHPIKNPVPSSDAPPDRGATSPPMPPTADSQVIVLRKTCDICGGYGHGRWGQRCTNPHAQCNDMKWCVVPTSHMYYHNNPCRHDRLSHYNDADDNDMGYDAYDGYDWEA